MRRDTLLAVLFVIVGLVLLAGCPKQQSAEVQGAPPAPAGTHMMPNGQTMTDQQMQGMKGMEGAKPQPAAATNKADIASCPVLGTTMAKKDMIPYEYKGKTYYLCCADCVAKFKADPEKYVNHPAKPLPLGAPMPSG